MASDLDALLQDRPVVLVFLPNTNELQRFVVSGAFDAIAATRRLHYVLPEDEAERMRSAAAPVITADNSTAIAVPPARFKKWAEVFNAGCIHYASRSPSFAIRAGLEVDPGWQESWRLPRKSMETLDRCPETGTLRRIGFLLPA